MLFHTHMCIYTHVHVYVCCSPDEVVVPRDDPMVQELSDVLREWSVVWKRLYAVSSTVTHMHTYSPNRAAAYYIL